MTTYKETRTLDLLKRRGRAGGIAPVTLRRGERGSAIAVTVTYDDEPFPLGGYSARFCAVNARGEVVAQPATVEDSARGLVSYTVTGDLTSVAGNAYVAYFMLSKDGEVATTDTLPIIVLEDADLTGEAAEEYESLISKLARELESGIEAAGSAASRADGAASAAASAASAADSASASAAAAEKARASAEAARAEAERGRASAEAARAEAERGRTGAEGARAAAEQARESAEAARAQAEARRAADFSVMEQRSKGWLRYYCTEGEYDAETRRPTVGDPDESTLYYVPAEEPTEDNLWIEWQYDSSGDRWELQGATEASFAPLSTEQIDGLLSGDPPSGSAVLTGAGLSYLWSLMASTSVGQLFG